MANTKSAIKRVQISERNRLHNKAYKSAIKTLTKKCLSEAEKNASDPAKTSSQDVQASLAQAYSKIDKAVKRGVLHVNTAARKKARLARTVKRLQTAASAS